MFETGLLYRMHSNSLVNSFDSKWWNYIDNYSKRDQLSFPVALVDMDLNCEFILPVGFTVRNHDGFVFTTHYNESCKFKRNKKAWLMHHYYKHHEDRDTVANLYYWVYNTHYPRFWATLFGLQYRVLDRIL